MQLTTSITAPRLRHLLAVWCAICIALAVMPPDCAQSANDVEKAVVNDRKNSPSAPVSPPGPLDARLETRDPESYAVIWRRAPFTLAATQTLAPPPRILWSADYHLVAWSNLDDKVVIASISTGVRQTVGHEPNEQGISLVNFELNPDQLLSKAILRKNNELGEVKFPDPNHKPVPGQDISETIKKQQQQQQQQLQEQQQRQNFTPSGGPGAGPAGNGGTPSSSKAPLIGPEEPPPPFPTGTNSQGNSRLIGPTPPPRPARPTAP